MMCNNYGDMHTCSAKNYRRKGRGSACNAVHVLSTQQPWNSFRACRDAKPHTSCRNTLGRRGGKKSQTLHALFRVNGAKTNEKKLKAMLVGRDLFVAGQHSVWRWGRQFPAATGRCKRVPPTEKKLFFFGARMWEGRNAPRWSDSNTCWASAAIWLVGWLWRRPRRQQKNKNICQPKTQTNLVTNESTVTTCSGVSMEILSGGIIYGKIV